MSFERKPKIDLHIHTFTVFFVVESHCQNLHIFALISMTSRYFNLFLRASRGAGNPNLKDVIMQESHVCNQHSFGLLLRMNGMHRTHFDHARLDLLSLS